MKQIALFTVLTLTAGLALAHNCPNEMKVIDAALPKAKLSAAQSTEVKKLRAEVVKLLQINSD